jgi:prepilin-type N-terminal cleavage/methylation domain-containing protein
MSLPLFIPAKNNRLGACAYKLGFTLLEVMVSVSILVLIVLMMATFFTQASNAWERGTKRSQEAQIGRVVMDFLMQDLSQVIADDLISFKTHSAPGPLSLSVSAYGLDSDSICFVAATRPPPYGMLRAAPHFIYYVGYMKDLDGADMNESHPEGPRYALMRTRKTGAVHSAAGLPNSAHRNPEWWRPQYWTGQPRELVVENISGFEVWAAKGSVIEAGEMNPDIFYIENYDSVEEGEPPLWVDIYLMIMSENDAIRAADLWRANHPDRAEFVELHSRRYTTRVYFRNREGYAR